MTSNQVLINKVTESQTKKNIPSFRTGDSVKVHLKIKEGSKERIQIYSGFVLKSSKKEGSDATFTVRKESYGIGVEKTFFLNSPSIAKIEVVKLGKVRQARIFYMRDRKGKSARIKPREEKSKKIIKKETQSSNNNKKPIKIDDVKSKEVFVEKTSN